MDWLTSFRKAIDYMEEHLLTDIGVQEVADAVYLSPFYFQKCFKIVTGYSVGEYLRNRRLYLAGLDVIRADYTGDEARCQSGNGKKGGKVKIIDLAYRYGYDSQESFTKAFTRFHGLSPMQLRAQPHRIKVFLPLIVEISVKGGSKMEYTIEKREVMKMIGFERTFSFESSYQEIPKFWQEFNERYGMGNAECEPGEEALRQTIAE